MKIAGPQLDAHTQLRVLKTSVDALREIPGHELLRYGLNKERVAGLGNSYQNLPGRPSALGFRYVNTIATIFSLARYLAPDTLPDRDRDVFLFRQKLARDIGWTDPLFYRNGVLSRPITDDTRATPPRLTRDVLSRDELMAYLLRGSGHKRVDKLTSVLNLVVLPELRELILSVVAEIYETERHPQVRQIMANRLIKLLPGGGDFEISLARDLLRYNDPFLKDAIRHLRLSDSQSKLWWQARLKEYTVNDLQKDAEKDPDALTMLHDLHQLVGNPQAKTALITLDPTHIIDRVNFEKSFEDISWLCRLAIIGNSRAQKFLTVLRIKQVIDDPLRLKREEYICLSSLLYSGKSPEALAIVAYAAKSSKHVCTVQWAIDLLMDAVGMNNELSAYAFKFLAQATLQSPLAYRYVGALTKVAPFNRVETGAVLERVGLELQRQKLVSAELALQSSPPN